MAARSFPTWIITQEPRMVPNRKGPFHDDKYVEELLRDAYRSNPDIICIVIDNPSEAGWSPQHGYEWLDMYGDRRKRHPRKDRPKQTPHDLEHAPPHDHLVGMDEEDRTPVPEGFDAAQWRKADEVHHAMALVASDTECVKILYAALAEVEGNS